MSRHRFGRPTRPEEHDDPELWRHQFGRRPRRWRAILRDAGLDASTIRLWARNANRGRRFGGYGNPAEEKIRRAVDWLTTPADYLPLPDEQEEAGRPGPDVVAGEEEKERWRSAAAPLAPGVRGWERMIPANARDTLEPLLGTYNAVETWESEAGEVGEEPPIRLGVDLDELLVAPLRRPTLPPIIIAGPALLDALALTMGDPPPQTAGYVDHIPSGGIDPVTPDDTASGSACVASPRRGTLPP